jgi:putative transposase
MPWKQTCPMDEKIKFIAAVKCGQDSFAEICRQFRISRKSGYKLMQRYEQEGEQGLKERSRAPHRHANAISDAWADELLKVKRRYPNFGPGKVLDRLVLEGREREELPAVSTVGELFKRHGLVKARRSRAKAARSTAPLSHASTPNAVWSIDFKGQFVLGNRRWCYPLTLTDNASRYLLVCRGMHRPTERGVWPYMELAFREYGLPRALRSDNGSPFASTGLGGLSRLSVWWLKLGILLERIAPGKPQQNGRHERMHRTLKQENELPKHDLRAQQRRFEWFQRFYNEERPHDSLDGLTPSHCYHASPRSYPATVPEPQYPVGFTVRRVRSNGQIKWEGAHVFVGEALVGEPIGLRQVDEHCWQVWFCTQKLGLLDVRSGKISRPQ